MRGHSRNKSQFSEFLCVSFTISETLTGRTRFTFPLTVYVKRRFPAEPVDQRAGQRHADHDARVRTAQGYGGESRSLQRRRPVSPDTVTSRVRDTLS